MITANYAKTLVLVLISCLVVISLDILLFLKFPKINYYNILLEFLLSLFALVPLFAIQKYKNNQFYWNLNIGFYLLFLSYFVDAIDQIFIHSVLYTFILEKTTLVIAAIFIYVGSRQWMDSFEKVALTDYLTQIPNRRLISQLVNKEISLCKKEGGFFSIALIDIDFFKKINDEHGHSVGDKILISFAKNLLKSLNKGDKIGRWGGEEFMVLMKNTTIDDAKQQMDYLREKISKKPLKYGESEHTCTVSIGISQWQDCSDNFENLFIKADRALYRAKKAGRNRVEF